VSAPGPASSLLSLLSLLTIAAFLFLLCAPFFFFISLRFFDAISTSGSFVVARLLLLLLLLLHVLCKLAQRLRPATANLSQLQCERHARLPQLPSSTSGGTTIFCRCNIIIGVFITVVGTTTTTTATTTTTTTTIAIIIIDFIAAAGTDSGSAVPAMKRHTDREWIGD
jgi:hypothetical protein